MSATNKLADNLVLKRDLSPEGRTIIYKGRIREALHVISANMTKLVLLNLIMVIACIPLLVMILYYQRMQESEILSGLNFSTGIGIGFGVQDDTASALAQIYDVRMFVYGVTLFPTFVLFGLFAAGLYHCCRNMLWGVNIKIRKHFFRGIKAHWYKYLISFAWLGVLATGFACSLIAILKENAVNGSANAGWWVLLVVCGILALASAVYMIIGNGMYALYKFKMNEYIKNTCCLTLLTFVPALIVVAFFSGVMALFFVKLISVFLMIVMIMIGFSAFCVFSLAFSQYICDNYIGYLNEQEEKNKRKEQERLARAKNQARKKQLANGKKKRR